MSTCKRLIHLRPVEAILLFLVLLLFPTACSCWPSLPNLIHRDGCGWPQYAATGSVKQVVSLPPKTYIAYSHQGDIWIMDNDGKNKKQLTSNQAREFSLSASYQKERIWFVRATVGEASPEYGNVYSCDYAGRDLKQVTSDIKVRFASVSPDGKTLAISVQKDIAAVADHGSAGATADMWLVDAAGAKLNAASAHADLTADLEPSGVGGREGSTYAAWSKGTGMVSFTFKPDGSASLGISTKAIYIANADGTGRRLVAKSADQPAFNGFGTSLAVTTGAHWDTMGVARVNPADGALEEVLPVASDGALYSTYDPIFMTTYEDIKEWPVVIYGKTTHPPAPAPVVNTLEKYRVDDAKTTVLDTREGADNLITHITTDNAYGAVFYQVGGGGSQAKSNSTIWSVKPDGTARRMLSAAAGAGDSEPTAAVSYNWYVKGKAGGTGAYANCHWPYQR